MTTHQQFNHSVARDESLARVEIGVLSAIFVAAVLGNVITLSVTATRRREKKNRMRLLVLHLSLADLFVAFFNVLPQLLWDVTFHFHGTNALCKFVKFGQVFGMYASSFVLLTTAFDRYLAICRPLLNHAVTSRRLHQAVLGAWFVAAVFSLPQVFIFSLVAHERGNNCWATFDPEWTLRLYVTWTSVALYISPCFLLIGLYSRICLRIWKVSRERTESNLSTLFDERFSALPSGSPSRLRCHVSRGMGHLKVKTVKMTLTVVVCYFVCWSPFFLSQLWAAYDRHAPFESTGMVIVLLLASLNSCANPWIYLAYSDVICRGRSYNNSIPLSRTTTSSNSKRTSNGRDRGSARSYLACKGRRATLSEAMSSPCRKSRF